MQSLTGAQGVLNYKVFMFKNIYYGWWVLLACFIINLYVNGVTFFGFTAFIEPIQHEFGWSYTQISFAMSLRGLEMGIFAPIIGFLVDRFGSRILLLSGAIITSIGLILLSFTQSLFMFYLGILFISFGAGGCASVVTMTAVASWFKKKVSLALGVLACAIGGGGLIIPLIVFLIDVSGWRTTLVILGVGMLLLGIPLSLIVRDRPEELGSSADGSTHESLRTSKPKDGLEETEWGFLQTLKKKSFLYLVIADIVRLIIVNAVLTHIMPYLSSIGMSRAVSGSLAGVLLLVSIVGRLGFGWLGDRFDKRIVWSVTFFLMSSGVFAFCYVQSFWVLLLFVILFAPGFGGGMVMRTAMLHEYFGMASFGKLLGIIMGFGALGGIIGPTLAGWVFDTLGSYNAVWYGFSMISAMTIFLIMKIKPTSSSQETP
jgi:MFS family permease